MYCMYRMYVSVCVCVGWKERLPSCEEAEKDLPVRRMGMGKNGLALKMVSDRSKLMDWPMAKKQMLGGLIVRQME